MANKLDLYDANKLIEARKLINQVHEYNWFPSTPLTKKLETIINKLDHLLENEVKEKYKAEIQKKHH